MSQENRASRLVAYKDEVELIFRNELPAGPDGVLHVATHVGRFGEDEVRRYLVKSPAVVLAPLNFDDIARAGGTSVFTIHYGAFVIVTHKNGVSRDDIAFAIIERIGLFLPTMWTECGQAPTEVDAGNLYTGKIDKLGLALWAIRWKQAIQIPQLDQCDIDRLDDFLRLNATYNLDDPDDPDDFDAEQQIELPGFSA